MAPRPASCSQHGGQPRRPHGHQLPRGAGQAARGQPHDHQRLPRPHPWRQGQLHPPHRLRRRACGRRRRAGHERLVRRGRRRQAARRAPPRHVGLGLAVDVEKTDGSRTLLVPVIREADTLDFRGFWAAYEDLIRKVRSNKLTPDDFAGATVTLTNPGTIGTVQSVPRLMPGQGVIVGVGALDYPAGFQAADPAHAGRARRVEGASPSRSTYDHRIIQGAESGLFLKRVHELLMGERRLLRRRLPLARRALRGRAVAHRRQPGRRASRRSSRSRCRCRRSSTCTGCGATSSPTSTR